MSLCNSPACMAAAPATSQGADPFAALFQSAANGQHIIKGLDAAVIGASNHVGRPMGLELLLAGASVTTVHKFTRDTAAKVRMADIVISAVGQPGLVTEEWIKPGAVVIDVGITHGDKNKLLGDVCFDEVKEVAGWITPVPGGVGPMTRVALLENTLLAARLHQEADPH